ncbi:tyrosine-type recombinase/integrase [Vibrio cyclitrophicus]
MAQQEARELSDRIRTHGTDAFRYTTFIEIVAELIDFKKWSKSYTDKTIQAVNARFSELANNKPIQEFVRRSGEVLGQLTQELEETRAADGKGAMYPRMVSLINRVMERAHALGLVTHNPYRAALGEMPSIESEHHAAPKESALTDIWAELNVIHEPKYVLKARAVKMAMLTGLRSINVLTMEWNDIKPVTKDEIAHIHISKGKSKNRLAFTVPITPEVQHILDEQRAICPIDSQYVFPSPSGGYYKGSLDKFVNDLGIGAKYSTTAHGFRAAYITKLNQIGAPEFLIKKSIGHNAYSDSLLPYDDASHLEPRFRLQLYYENFILGKNHQNLANFCDNPCSNPKN